MILHENKVLKGLSFSQVFKCQEVCSKWNHAVDKLIPQFQHLKGRWRRYTDLIDVAISFEHFLEAYNCFTNKTTLITILKNWHVFSAILSILIHQLIIPIVGIL